MRVRFQLENFSILNDAGADIGAAEVNADEFEAFCFFHA
jgi:hypothetical protein